MSNSASILASNGTAYPPTPIFNSLLSTFQRLKYSHGMRQMMAWARQRSLEEDLEQLGLMEMANLVDKFDPAVGTTLEQFVGCILPRRMFSCLRTLKSAYCDPIPKQENSAWLSHADIDVEDDTQELEATSQADHTLYNFDFSGDSSQTLSERTMSRLETAWDAHRHDAFNGDPVGDELQRNQMALRLRIKIEQLPSRQCEIILLTLEDYTDGEIATHLGVSKQAVSKAKLKAMATLSATMKGAMQ